jgi:hypothetical protein
MSIKAMAWAKEQTAGSAPTKLVLFALADVADDYGLAWPSMATLAKECEMSERSVRNHVAALEQAGLLRRIERFAKSGRQRSNYFQLETGAVRPEDDEGEAANLAAPTRKHASARGGKSLPPIEQSKELPEGTTPLAPKGASDLFELEPEPAKSQNDVKAAALFEEFWRRYPRKVAKPAAEKAFGAAVKRHSPEDIFAGLATFRFSDDPRFIPHAATWLNQRRWMDEPADAGPSDDGPAWTSFEAVW